MEKKIKRTKKSTKSVSYSDEEKTIIITIIIALVIIGALLVNVVNEQPSIEKFSSIYYLDSQKQTENIPKTVVLGENDTFTLYVGVENQNGTTIDYSVKLKIDDGNGPLNQSSAMVLDHFEKTLKDGDIWEFPVTIDREKLVERGTKRIIFELWLGKGTADDQYSGKWVNLSVEVV